MSVIKLIHISHANHLIQMSVFDHILIQKNVVGLRLENTQSVFNLIIYCVIGAGANEQKGAYQSQLFFHPGLQSNLFER